MNHKPVKELRDMRDEKVKFPTLLPAKLIKRENRFKVKIQLGNMMTFAHLANPGRLKELLITGTDIWVSKAENPKRRTAYSLELVKARNTLISMNSQVPNKLVNRALCHHSLPNLPDYTIYHREVMLGRSRIDFCIKHSNTLTWLEVKSVTLVRNGVAYFPDAPTLRGQRHLSELMEAVRSGDKGMVVFVIQRYDAQAFQPNDETDPEFGRLLRHADKAGISIAAIDCKVTTEEITLNHILLVYL